LKRQLEFPEPKRDAGRRSERSLNAARDDSLSHAHNKAGIPLTANTPTLPAAMFLSPGTKYSLP
jgi:hypothetical protein